MMQGSRVKSVGRGYLKFIQYGAGTAMIATGLAILATASAIYIKPFGLCFALSGALLLPITGQQLAKRWKQFEPWYVPLLMAGAALWGGIVFSVASYNTWQQAHPEIAAKRAADRKAKEAADEAKKKAEADRLAKQEEATALASRGDRQKALNLMWGQVTAQMEPCEKSQRYFAELLGQPGAIVQSYQMARQGQQICFQSRTGLQQIAVPDILSEQASKLATEGLEGCANAMLARMTYLSIAGKVIDGDRRPSRLAEAQAQSQAADAATLQCVAKLTEAAMADGLKLEKR